jgi:hypothetical protein
VSRSGPCSIITVQNCTWIPGEDQKEALRSVGACLSLSDGDGNIVVVTIRKKKIGRGRTFFRVIASAMQKLVARSNSLCTGYCGELGALSHPLSAFPFPFSCPDGAVGRGGVIVTPAAVSLASRCHNHMIQTIYRPPFMMAVL